MSADPRLNRIRSLLFAPADNPKMLAGLAKRGADAVVLDLEDAVANSAKGAARQQAAAYLRHATGLKMATVRVNGIETGLTEEDLSAVVGPGLDAVVVPKVQGPEDLIEVSALIAAREAACGLTEGAISVLAMIETPNAVLAAEQIATANPRLRALVLGSGDLASTVGLGSLTGPELDFARSSVVFASSAARLAPALDGPYLTFRDTDGLASDSRRSRAFGFGGRVVIHPGQVGTVHEAYSGSDDIDHLRRVVAAFEKAEAGGAAAIDVDGRFVDYPIYRAAVRQIEELQSEEPAA